MSTHPIVYDPGTVMKFQISLLRLGDAVQHPAPVAVEEAKQLRELADLHRTASS